MQSPKEISTDLFNKTWYHPATYVTPIKFLSVFLKVQDNWFVISAQTGHTRDLTISHTL